MCFNRPDPSGKMMKDAELNLDTHLKSQDNPKLRTMRNRSISPRNAPKTCSVISDGEDSPSKSADTKPPTKKKERPCVNHDYFDHAYERDPESSYSSDDYDYEVMASSRKKNKRNKRGPRGGVTVPFPEKLHMLLSNVEKDGYDDVISWQPHGRCFMVRNPKKFVAEVMPTYFRQTKLTSFQRQLNLYGFCRLVAGEDKGAYYHELFLRDRLFLCKNMMRTRIKGTGIKAAMNPKSEPNFYKMPFIKPLEETPAAPPYKWEQGYEECDRSETASTVSTTEDDEDLDEMEEDVVEEEDTFVDPVLSSVEPLPIVEPSVVIADDEEIIQAAFKPPCFPMEPHKPLSMPILPCSVDTIDIKKAMAAVHMNSAMVTPPQTPIAETTLPPPPEVPSDWLLSSDTAFQEEVVDEGVMFEGKTFHYLDSSVFSCLDEGAGRELDTCASSDNFMDAFFASW